MPAWLSRISIVVAIALAGCAPAPTGVASATVVEISRPTPSLLPEPTSIGLAPVPTLPPVVGSLAPAPADCSPTGPPDRMTLQEFGGGFSDGTTVVGHAPVWTLGLPTDGVLSLPPVSSRDVRFPSAKIMWLVGPNVTEPVTVTGAERSTGDPMWFQVYPPNTDSGLPSSYTTTLQLDPAVPNRGFARNASGSWSIWGIGVGARAAGCYSMAITSSKGTWTVELAIGDPTVRIPHPEPS
jgi:hypothetical protein